MPSFGGRVSPGERLRRLSPHECKAWVCSHHEGRLGYQSGRGHRSVVVFYAVAGDQIWLVYRTNQGKLFQQRFNLDGSRAVVAGSKSSRPALFCTAPPNTGARSRVADHPLSFWSFDQAR